MDEPGLLVALLIVLGYGFVSARLESRWISMPMAMVALGFLLGADGLGLVEVDVRSEVVRTAAEVTLALMLFHDAVRIDLRALRAGSRIPVRLLAIGLPLMIAIGTLVAWGMFPTIGLAVAALIATMLAPTDAALGEAVVSDSRLPVSIRQGLNVESGLNDGLSVPVFLVLLAVCADPAALEKGVLVSELARQIGFGLLGGALVGGLGGLVFRAASARGAMLESWRSITILIVALGCFVCAAVLGGSGFIGAFSGGVIFGLASEARSPQESALTEQLGTFFDAVSFVLVGAMLLPLALENMSWTLVAYAVLSLMVLRLASVAIAMAGSGARPPTVAFMGWFGPRGLATVVFTVMVFDSGIAEASLVTSIAVIGIVLSVFAHGLTAPPLVSAYASWWRGFADAGGAGPETESVHEHRTRFQDTAA